MEPDLKPSYHLSPTQALIWKLLSSGLTQRDISTRLHISLNTFNWHRRILYQRLHVYNKYEAIKLYLLTFGPPDT